VLGAFDGRLERREEGDQEGQGQWAGEQEPGTEPLPVMQATEVMARDQEGDDWRTDGQADAEIVQHYGFEVEDPAYHLADPGAGEQRRRPATQDRPIGRK
jgi:hypothetical protein